MVKRQLLSALQTFNHRQTENLWPCDGTAASRKWLLTLPTLSGPSSHQSVCGRKPSGAVAKFLKHPGRFKSSWVRGVCEAAREARNLTNVSLHPFVRHCRAFDYLSGHGRCSTLRHPQTRGRETKMPTLQQALRHSTEARSFSGHER